MSFKCWPTTPLSILNWYQNTLRVYNLHKWICPTTVHFYRLIKYFYSKTIARVTNSWSVIHEYAHSRFLNGHLRKVCGKHENNFQNMEIRSFLNNWNIFSFFLSLLSMRTWIVNFLTNMLYKMRFSIQWKCTAAEE